MIHLQGVGKSFYLQKKEPGLKASLKSLLWRQTTERVALQPLDLSIKQGEFVGLLGANGAGKTTLVKICTGIIRASTGQVRVLEHDPWRRSDEFRRRISLIMGQKAQLWWDLPAGDCFRLLREIYRIPDAEFQARLAQLTEILDVGGLVHTQIRRLSLGERMKMELIAALLHEPDLIFLDEPTIGLDISSQRALRDFIKRYHESHKPTVVLTSHYIEDIESLCRRIIVLRDGQVVYDGELKALVAKYGAQKTLQLSLAPDHAPPRLDVLTQTAPILKDACVQNVRYEQGVLTLEVDRHQTSKVAASLMQNLPVLDLSVADADVAGIIARIQDRGSVLYA